MSADSAGDLDSIVIFRLGGQAFALAVEAVREVVPIAWLATAPRMPSFVQGFLNLGGIAIPVLRLDKLLGLNQEIRFGLEASILIMRGQSPMGLLVERVDDVRHTASFENLAVDGGHSFNGCVTAQLAPIATGGTEPIPLVSWRNVLLAEEHARTAEFQAHAQARLADLAEAAS